jgi:hypothetical protein
MAFTSSGIIHSKEIMYEKVNKAIERDTRMLTIPFPLGIIITIAIIVTPKESIFKLENA